MGHKRAEAPGSFWKDMGSMYKIFRTTTFMHREVDDPIDIHTFFDGKSRVEGDAVTANVPAPAGLPGAYKLAPPLFGGMARATTKIKHR